MHSSKQARGQSFRGKFKGTQRLMKVNTVYQNVRWSQGNTKKDPALEMWKKNHVNNMVF